MFITVFATVYRFVPSRDKRGPNLMLSTGINAIIYYAPSIFTAVGLSGNSVDLLATGVVGIINFLFTIPAIMFIDRFASINALFF